MEFDIYGIFKNIFDEEINDNFNNIENNEISRGIDQLQDFETFTQDAWNVNSYTKACTDICRNSVKTDERFKKFASSDILACVKVEDTSQFFITRQSKKSRRVRFSTGVSISVDSHLNSKMSDDMTAKLEQVDSVISDAELVRGLPYPHIGEGENKIISAYLEDLRTVGYGRSDKENYPTYNNPFDPRLTFQGFGYNAPPFTEEVQTNKDPTENVFLAIDNIDKVLDVYFNGYRNHLRELCNSPVKCFSRTNKKSSDDLNTRGDPVIDVADDDSPECRLLFDKIRSDSVRNIWSATDEDPKSSVHRGESINHSQTESGATKNQQKEKGDEEQFQSMGKTDADDIRATQMGHTEENGAFEFKQKDVSHDTSFYPEMTTGENCSIREKRMSPLGRGLDWSINCWSKTDQEKEDENNTIQRDTQHEDKKDTTHLDIEREISEVKYHVVEVINPTVDNELVIDLRKEPWSPLPIDEPKLSENETCSDHKVEDKVPRQMKDLQNWADILFKKDKSHKGNTESRVETGHVNIVKNSVPDDKTKVVVESCTETSKPSRSPRLLPTVESSVTRNIDILKSEPILSAHSSVSTRSATKISDGNSTKVTASSAQQPSQHTATSHHKTADYRSNVPNTQQKQQQQQPMTHTRSMQQQLAAALQHYTHGGHRYYSGYNTGYTDNVLHGSRSLHSAGYFYQTYESQNMHYPIQALTQPPPGFSHLGGNHGNTQHASRQSSHHYQGQYQNNIQTPLVSSPQRIFESLWPVNMAAARDGNIAHPRYAQQVFSRYPAGYQYYQTNGSIQVQQQQEYNFRSGWNINMNNNNNRDNNYCNMNMDNNNNNNNTCAYDEYEHQPESMFPRNRNNSNNIEILPTNCGIDTYQDKIRNNIRSKPRPIRSNLIQIFPSND